MHLCPNCTFVVREETETCPKCGFSFSVAPPLNLEDEQVYRAVVASSAIKNTMEIEKVRRWVTVIGISSLVSVLAVLIILLLAVISLM